MAMTEPSRSPTLEAVEEHTDVMRARARAIKESLYTLMSDLGYHEPTAVDGDAASEQDAIIGRIVDKQQAGLETLGDCERLVGEVRRRLFSTPINAKTLAQPHSTYRGERAERIA